MKIPSNKASQSNIMWKYLVIKPPQSNRMWKYLVTKPPQPNRIWKYLVTKPPQSNRMKIPSNKASPIHKDANRIWHYYLESLHRNKGSPNPIECKATI